MHNMQVGKSTLLNKMTGSASEASLHDAGCYRERGRRLFWREWRCVSLAGPGIGNPTIPPAFSS